MQLFTKQIFVDGRTFVTAVREPGVQATLLTVSEQMGEGGPLLQPYPNWEWNEYDFNTKPDCDNTIISVYRVSVSISTFLERHTVTVNN